MPERTSTSLEFSFVCPLSGGLHARPASHLADVANEYVSECILANLRNGSVASLKSVLAIISADVREGDSCTVRVEGTDERQAQTALLQFVNEVLPGCDVPLPKSDIAVRDGTIPRALKSTDVPFCFGAPASSGIGQGRVVFLDGMSLRQRINGRGPVDALNELEQIKRATSVVCARLREKLKHSKSTAEAGILQADLAIANDVSLAQKLRESVLQGMPAGEAVAAAGEFFIDLLRRSGSEYISDRALDIEEICLQLLGELYGNDFKPANVQLSGPSVVVVESLAPQQLLALDRQHLQALVVGHSGATSHAIILARSLGIPAVVGVKNARQMLSPSQEIVVDAIRGLIATRVPPAIQRFYEREMATLERRRNKLSSSANVRATTIDGRSIEVAANAASYDELRLAFESGADGIGLFRTEGLFLGREHAPSEEEQFEIYAHAARIASGRPVIIRTFDLGGDKPVPYLSLPVEKNPFLGYRGSRIYTEHTDLLQSQLRAILRASVFGRVQIMAPMIASLEDVLLFKAQLSKAKQHLHTRGTFFAPDIPVGMMIEVPSAGFILDQLCREVDFFSLGTNDLNQYFLAADRDNPKTASLSDRLHPGFLRFLQKIVGEVHAAGKWIGMCGQMAAEIHHLPLLLGLGLDEISIPSAKILEVKRAVLCLSANNCESLLSRAIALGSSTEIENLIDESRLPHSSQPLLTVDLIMLESDTSTKEEAIQEIVDAFYVAGRTDNRMRLEEAVWAREAVYPTGLGYGFAAPHCKTDAVNADSIAVLKLKQGIEWGSVDGQPVNMIILIAMREAHEPSRHMQVFSQLARNLMNEEFRRSLLNIEDAPKMTSYLARELGVGDLAVQ